ncbi:MAG: twin-arginine translocase subunit TatC [Bacteroidetes bacterium]|nr:twin-arginine translocase subunit TatC [Bacteroidota bacterium]
MKSYSDSNPEEDSEEPGAEMSFLDHLGELRQRVIKVILIVLVMMGVSFIFSNEIIKFLLNPPILLPDLKPPMQLMRPVITQVQGLMVVKLQIGLIAGIVLSLPVILYQIWRFISPGLKKKERRFAFPIILSSIVFFLAGAAFAFLIVIPITLNFLLTMGNIDAELGIVIENMIDIDQYLGFVSGFMLITGITFQLPVISFFLTRIGVLSSRFMRKYWRHAVIVALTVSAIVTPTTDMITLFVIAVPIILLYEVSIWVSFVTERRKRKS